MLTPADIELIRRIRGTTVALGALLCAFARRGKALFRDEPARADALLSAIRPHPLYRAGKIQFDLLELDELMIDGTPLPLGLDERELIRAMTRVLERIEQTLEETGGGAPAQSKTETRPKSSLSRELSPEPAPPGGWPVLDASDYLYDLVVLGLLRELSRMRLTG